MSDAGTASGSVGVVIVAAGSGTRLGAAIPKAFVEVGGRRILDWAVTGAHAVPSVAEIVLVVPSPYVEALAAQYAAASAGPSAAPIAVVAGGRGALGVGARRARGAGPAGGDRAGA